MPNIEILRTLYFLQLLILPTRAPFRLEIPTYLSRRIFSIISRTPGFGKKVKNKKKFNFNFSACELSMLTKILMQLCMYPSFSIQQKKKFSDHFEILENFFEIFIMGSFFKLENFEKSFLSEMQVDRYS